MMAVDWGDARRRMALYEKSQRAEEVTTELQEASKYLTITWQVIGVLISNAAMLNPVRRQEAKKRMGRGCC